MVVIWGTRNAGKIDQRGGQYAVTRFAHIYGVPLVPVSAMWVTSDGVGHATRLSARGVIAGYARTWGLVVGATGVAGIGGTVGFAAALFGVSLAALSWAWKDVSATTAQRRSDFNQLAFGTRCEPKLLSDELAASLRHEANERWALVSEGESPGDVARFGADDLQRAAAAYGVLRLSALDLPPAQAAEAERDAARIVDGVREQLQLGDGGPYRSRVIADRMQPEQPVKAR